MNVCSHRDQSVGYIGIVNNLILFLHHLLRKVFGLEGCIKKKYQWCHSSLLFLMSLLRLFPQGKTEESEWRCKYWLTGSWLTMIDSWVHFRVGKKKSYALCWTHSLILIMSDLAFVFPSFTCMTFPSCWVKSAIIFLFLVLWLFTFVVNLLKKSNKFFFFFFFLMSLVVQYAWVQLMFCLTGVYWLQTWSPGFTWGKGKMEQSVGEKSVRISR